MVEEMWYIPHTGVLRGYKSGCLQAMEESGDTHVKGSKVDSERQT
jgi:hypothetical protein